jgi:Holliday junction resolvasome RuvABC endonuclease subunit
MILSNRVIAGIDYSYTSPAICILGDDFKSSKHYFMTGKKSILKETLPDNFFPTLLPKEYSCSEERWFNICRWAIETLIKNGVTEVHLEGYAYGSSAGLVFQIAEHAGLLKHYMWRNSIPYEIYSPPAIKKQYTGKGNSNKEGMALTLLQTENVNIVKDLGLKDISNPASDIVDAYAIALMSRMKETSE